MDEARGRAVLEGVALLVGRETVVVQRDGSAAADDLRVALVQPHAHLAGDDALRGRHEGVERGLRRREPEAVVDERGVAVRELGLQVLQVALDRQRLRAPWAAYSSAAAGAS